MNHQSKPTFALLLLLILLWVAMWIVRASMSFWALLALLFCIALVQKF